MLFGRTTGISSIFNSLVSCGHDSSFRWKFGFFCGLITGTYGIFMIFGHTLSIGNVIINLFDPQETAQQGLSTLGFALSGLLVGFGSKLGKGCVTEHAICGIPRLSLSSFISVLMLLSTGILTATLRTYYPLMLSDLTLGKEAIEQYKTIADFLYVLLLIYFAYDLNVNSLLFREKLETLACLFIGLVFGLGLSISGTSRRTQVLDFFNLASTDGWNPTLLITILTAIGVNVVTFNLILKQKPMFAASFEIPNNPINWKTIIGPAIYGTGWGLTGLSTGSAMVNVLLLMKMLAYLPFMAAGQLLADWVLPRKRTEPKKEMKFDKYLYLVFIYPHYYSLSF
jgi:uncharacterized membrane protein YedE/YeeE